MIHRDSPVVRVFLIATVVATLLAMADRRTLEPAPAQAQSISSAADIDEGADRVPGQVIVKYRMVASASERASIASQLGATRVSSIDRLDVHLLRTTAGEELDVIRRL